MIRVSSMHLYRTSSDVFADPSWLSDISTGSMSDLSDLLSKFFHDRMELAIAVDFELQPSSTLPYYGIHRRMNAQDQHTEPFLA